MIVFDTNATPTASTPPATDAVRATTSTCRSVAAGRRNRLYKSCDSDVASMNSTASAALTSAENTAASPSAPTQNGTSFMKIIGSASSRFANPGCSTCEAMPSSVGISAYARRPTAFRPTPRRTVRSLRAP